ncbi:MAG TPA: pyridine nucleotide-disulfide oxidoreductase [Clostridiales bacterium]|nr:pyridine nucleotide-disulfide oxidoreductase [Clostridiales bacterium]
MVRRKNILKLATKISLESLTYTGITYDDCEYRILEPVVTDEMCNICMHMKLNTPRSVSEIAKRAGASEDDTSEQIRKLREAGIVRAKTVDGVKGYYYPIWVPGIMEGMLTNREQCDRFPVIGECFEEYTRKRTAPLAPNLENGMSFMRVIPVEQAIKNDSRAASYDEISTLIEKAKAISVGPCSCRRSRRLMGEGCGHLEEDMCMYLNDSALNFAEIGSHRLVSKEEAYDILRRAEENGLIHEINQTDGFEETIAICNCCGCSCYSLRIARYFRTPDGIRSNYVARVDKDRCVACGQCVEACQMNAVKLGRKLCSVTPEAEEAPDSRPSEKFWGRKDYNEDYRTDRAEVVGDGTAPCKAECPAHVPVQGYIKLAAQGRYRDALALIKAYNPFPAVCGRICNRRCEDACTRGGIDDPVAIDEIKKFIAEQELREAARFVPPMVNQTGRPYPNKIAVIGSGPAGLSCAYYLATRGYPVTVFEKAPVPGGMLTLGIPGFRLEKDVVNAEIEVLRQMGVTFKTGVEIGRDVSLDQLRAQGYEAFYLGIGAGAGTVVGCPGDDLAGVHTAIALLRAVNLGERPQIGSRVAVIGGGNVAVDMARTAVRLGAGTVTVVYRRGREEMPAGEEETAQAGAEGIKFLFLRNPAEILGGVRAEALKLEVMTLGAPDSTGRRTPRGTGKFEQIPIDSVISATGQKVDLSGIEKGSALTFNQDGTVIADPFTYQTAQPDVFAGGDVVTGPKYAIDAIAAGREGAESIHRYVHEGQTLDLGRSRGAYRAFDASTAAVGIANFDNTPRQKAADSAGAGFSDTRGVFTEEQMKKETERCLGCGAAVVNENMCLGCGICTTKCRFDAISLVKIHDSSGTPYYRTLSRVLGAAAKRYGRLAVKTVAKAGGKNGLESGADSCMKSV